MGINGSNKKRKQDNPKKSFQSFKMKKNMKIKEQQVEARNAEPKSTDMLLLANNSEVKKSGMVASSGPYHTSGSS